KGEIDSIHAAFSLLHPSSTVLPTRHFSICTVSMRAFPFFSHPHSLLTRHLNHFAMPMRHPLFR
ncbi:hypothetical protein, partial [Paenibacillus thiaminolyticus]|uniref:hypothetical protein n=1 Tax=Paenibacillus thiaminolyticus TaxID=49283 RepID=UPI001C3F8D79